MFFFHLLLHHNIIHLNESTSKCVFLQQLLCFIKNRLIQWIDYRLGLIAAKNERHDSTKSHAVSSNTRLPIGCWLHQEILEQGYSALFLWEPCPAFVSIPPCSNTPASNGRHYQASAEPDAELNQVCLSRATWKTCRREFPKDQGWGTLIQGPKQIWSMESNNVRLIFSSFLWLEWWVFTCWWSLMPDVMCCTAVSNRFTHKTCTKTHGHQLPQQPDPHLGLLWWMHAWTHRKSVEQVCKHLRGQRALPPAQERDQSFSEDTGDPLHVHLAHERQLNREGHLSGFLHT